MNPLAQIVDWFRKCKPEPTEKDFNTQMGVHFEEFGEMFDAIGGRDAASQARIDEANRIIKALAEDTKKGIIQIGITDPVEFADAIGDQVVTGPGAARIANILILETCQEIANSNDSKFGEDGNPIFDENRKVMKGPNYFKPNLAPFVQDARFVIESV